MDDLRLKALAEAYWNEGRRSEADPNHDQSFEEAWDALDGGLAGLTTMQKLHEATQLTPIFSADPWGHYDFSKTSLAVVACDGHGNGCILHHVGGHIAFDLSEVGRGLGDIGLDNAPEGISVWEGRHVGSGEDVTLEGDFRDPTDAEAAAIAAGECPWNEADWHLPDEPCEHRARRILQHGSEKHDRIEWCPTCGALRLYGAAEWELPDREAAR